MRVWRKVDVSGVEYTITLASDKERPEVLNCHGVTLPDNQEIILASDLSPSRFPSTLLHEILHAVYHESGISEMLKERFDLTPREYEIFDEAFIQLQTPVLLRALTTCGWKAPKR